VDRVGDLEYTVNYIAGKFVHFLREGDTHSLSLRTKGMAFVESALELEPPSFP